MRYSWGNRYSTRHCGVLSPCEFLACSWSGIMKRGVRHTRSRRVIQEGTTQHPVDWAHSEGRSRLPCPSIHVLLHHEHHIESASKPNMHVVIADITSRTCVIAVHELNERKKHRRLMSSDFDGDADRAKTGSPLPTCSDSQVHVPLYHVRDLSDTYGQGNAVCCTVLMWNTKG